MRNTLALTVLALTMTISAAAQAAIVCKVQTHFGPAQVEIDGTTVKVSGSALKRPAVFKKTVEVYDGHATSLITAPGLAISYGNIYGCIRNAKITTNFREDDAIGYIETVEARTCTGGSSPDEYCR